MEFDNRLVGVRAVSLGLSPRPQSYHGLPRTAELRVEGARIPVRLDVLDYVMWTRTERALRVTFDPAAFGGTYYADLGPSHGLTLDHAALVLVGAGMGLFVQAFTVAGGYRGAGDVRLNDLAFQTGRTHASDARLYGAIAEMLTGLRLVRASAEFELDFVSSHDDPVRADAERAAFFEDKAWRATHFHMAPDDAATQDRESYDTPMPRDGWDRLEVTRLSRNLGLYAWTQIDGEMSADRLLRHLIPFSIPLMTKSLYEAARSNCLALSTRFITLPRPGYGERQALSFIARTKVRLSHFLLLRSFLSPSQKVLHDRNWQYYELEAERTRLQEDIDTLRTAVEARRIEASERFSRRATALALTFTALSFVSTVTATTQFFLDPDIADRSLKMSVVIASLACAVLALAGVLLIRRR